VVVRVHERRRNDRALDVDALVGLRLCAVAEPGDETVLEQHPAARQLRARVVQRQHVAVREQ
jgi:hypothetical protein